MKRLSLLFIICSVVVTSSLDVFAQQEARLLDTFGNICCDDELARLDNFAIQLQNDPEVQGYIIFYGGRRYGSPYCHSTRLRIARRGDAEARVARLKPYLTATRGIDASRIVVINGGYREEWTAELWIIPKGATPPTPTPSIKPEEIKFRKGKPGRFDCDV